MRERDACGEAEVCVAILQGLSNPLSQLSDEVESSETDEVLHDTVIRRVCAVGAGMLRALRLCRVSGTYVAG
jgi:hypothetical protein